MVVLTAASLIAGGSAGGVGATSRVPVLFPLSQRTVEGDTPPAVRALLEGEQRAAIVRARAAAKQPRTSAAGCVPFTDAGGKRSLGPPAPTVRARIIGHHVEVLFSYRQLPASAACRPAAVWVVVFSGKPASTTFNNAGAVGTYAVAGPDGRVLVDLPWNGSAPYSLQTSSSTLLGLFGPRTRQPLACPAAGCLLGYQPAAHSWPMPKPV